jgi:hypothetical protein
MDLEPKSLKVKSPMNAESKEATRIATLELTIVAESGKAKMVIKIDMVNPMPANIPAAMICFQATPDGKEAVLICTATALNSTIPIGLPKVKPIMIPKLFTEPSVCKISPERIMPVFANAKTGTIK